MEMILLYAYLISSFLVVTLPLFFLSRKNKQGQGLTHGSLPPAGRTGWWWVIEENLQFIIAGLNGKPQNFILDRMAKYSPVAFRTHLFGQRFAVFCGSTGNKFLFTNESKLVQVWWPGSVKKLLSSTNFKQDTDMLRKTVMAFLKPESLQKYIGIMDKVCQEHFDSSWGSRNEEHIVKAFPLCNRCTFMIASKILVSVDDPTQVDKLLEPFTVFAKGLFSIPINLPGTAFNRAIKASKNVRKLFDEMLKQRKIDLAEGKASPTQDILSHMLLTSNEIKNGNFMNEYDITSKIMGLLIGAHDTSTSICASIVYFLADFPEVYDRVYEEQMEIARSKAPGELLNWNDIQKMKYSWNVACEVFRLAPPNSGTFREAIADFTFNGFLISKGSKIHWNAHSTHRNPECFPQPDKFDPSRFEGDGPAPFTFVPFGGGPRMCPGKEFARAEILVFMYNLVKRFRWEKIMPDEKLVASPMPTPAHGLPIKLYPHKA